MSSQEFLHGEVVQKAYCDRIDNEATVIIRHAHGRAACKHFSEGGFLQWSYGTCKLVSKIFFQKRCYFFQKPKKIALSKDDWEELSPQERLVILKHYLEQEDTGKDD